MAASAARCARTCCRRSQPRHGEALRLSADRGDRHRRAAADRRDLLLPRRRRPLLAEFARLDTMVTVVDAAIAATISMTPRFSAIAAPASCRADERTLIDLWSSRSSSPTSWSSTRCARSRREEKARVLAIVAALNADAIIVETDFGRVAARRCSTPSFFSEEKAATHPLWHKELYAARDHVPETEEYGISSFVYPRARARSTPASKRS